MLWWWSKRFCFASTFNDVRLSVRTGGTGGARGAPDTPNFWAFFLKWPSKHYYWDPSSFLTFRLACLHSYSLSAKSLSFASNEVFTYEHRFKKLIASIQVTSYQKAPAGQQLLTRATRKRPGGSRAGNTWVSAIINTDIYKIYVYLIVTLTPVQRWSWGPPVTGIVNTTMEGWHVLNNLKFWRPPSAGPTQALLNSRKLFLSLAIYNF